MDKNPMNFHLVSWVADSFRVQSFTNAEGMAKAAARAPEGQRCVEVTGPGDLKPLSGGDLVALRNFLSPGKPIKMFQDKGKGIASVWSLLSTRGEPEEKSVFPEKPWTKPAVTEGSTSDSVSATAPSVAHEGEGDMATKKSKKRAKTNGAAGPRGEKTKKVAALLTRKSGCTRADILEATGWPAVSVQQMAKAAGLKLKKEKNKGEPTRYYGE